MRVLASLAGVLGGACLLASALADLTGTTGDAVRYAGFGLLAVAVLCLGLLLVPRAPVWLQAIVGLGCVGLAGSVLATVYTEMADDLVDTVLGGAAAVLFLVLGLRWFLRRTPRRQGSHSR